MNDTTSNDDAENVEVSSEEVDALLEKQPGQTADTGDQGSGLVRSYDLVAPDKIVRSRMPAFGVNQFSNYQTVRPARKG